MEIEEQLKTQVTYSKITYNGGLHSKWSTRDNFFKGSEMGCCISADIWWCDSVHPPIP